MKTWSRALVIAVLCLAVSTASGEAPPKVEVPSDTAPVDALAVGPAADAQPLGFIPWGPGGGDDQLGTCTIYCDGQPRPFQATYDECCGGGHLCPDGSFPSGGNTYWSPNYGSPMLCTF